MKRFLTILTASALCLFVASSCSDDDEGYVPYTGPEHTPGTPGGPDAEEGVLITLPNEEEQSQSAYADQTEVGSFTFTSKKSWIVEIYEGEVTDFTSTPRSAANASWVKLYRFGAEKYNGGVGTFKLDIEVEPNYTGEDRVATIAVRGGMDIVTVTLTQSSKKEDGEELTIDWTWDMAADSCTFVLIDQFLNKNKGVFKATPTEAGTALYWQNAHSMDVMIYSYERIRESDPDLAATYRGYMEKWFQARGNNYVTAEKGFWNNYTDDMAWMSLTLMHMAEATGEQKYFAEARKIYDEYMLEPARIINDDDGWGLVWTLDKSKSEAERNARNACTNTPAGIIACKLYLKTGDEKYLKNATDIYDYMWKTGKINAEGRMAEPPLTYTQGTWTEMCRLLYHITGVSKYMLDAETCMKFTMKAGGRCCNADGILRDEGGSQDQSLFKAVCIPYMVNMTNDPLVSIVTRREIKAFLLKNAQSCWFKSMDRTLPLINMYANTNWTSPYDGAREKALHGSQTSAASLLEGVTRLPENL